MATTDSHLISTRINCQQHISASEKPGVFTATRQTKSGLFTTTRVCIFFSILTGDAIIETSLTLKVAFNIILSYLIPGPVAVPQFICGLKPADLVPS